jgi:hypothetical protein
MKAPITQEEIDYRADLTNKINAISSIQGLFTDIEDKPRRLRILKALLAVLNYGDEINAEIDGEIKALEEAAAAEATTESEEGTEEIATETDTESEAEPTEDDTDLGSLEALEAFNTGTGDILLEDQEITNGVLLTEDDLPSPEDLDAEKDFSENN